MAAVLDHANTQLNEAGYHIFHAELCFGVSSPLCSVQSRCGGELGGTLAPGLFRF